MLRTALLILSGNTFGSLMLLIRNLAVARLVSIEDYGIAATFAISMAIVEMASGLGLQQLIIQDKTGDDPRLQAGLQGFNLLRSALSGTALFLLAAPIANFLGIPEIAWAYQLLALIPILKGFEHFDIYRLNRKMQFRPLILTKTVPALISVLSVWPLYQVFGDYQVMLYAVLIQSVCKTAMSHLVAQRPYQVVFERSTMLHSLRFGWPLLINNILLFAVFQGDKLIVGREIGIEALAIFSMGITLTLTPTLVMANTTSSFFLPQLSTIDAKDRKQFSRLALTAMQASLLNGLLLVTGMVLIGKPLVSILLGSKFEALIPLLPWLAVLQAIRLSRSGSTVVALSQAFTGNAMIANSFRILVLPVGWYIAVHDGSLLQIIWVAIIGEFCASAASYFLVSYRLKLNLRRMILPVLAALTLMAATAVHANLSSSPEHPEILGAGVIVILFLIALSSMRELLNYVINKTGWDT